MKKKIITVDISAKELKKKLDIKDGYTPIKGVDYFDGENGQDAIVDTENIALEASKLTLEKIKPSIPTIEQIEQDIPKLGEPIRDSLELLQGSERLDKKAILGLEDYDEISKLAREKSKKQTVVGGAGARQFTALTDVPNSYSGQAGKFPKVNAGETGLEFADVPTPTTPSLQQVTDVGATTTVESTFSTGLITPQLKASTSAGQTFKTNSGADWLHGGNGGSANATMYGGWNYDNATADTIASFGASKTLTSLSTSTYPSLSELSYVKGVTSAIQTQLNGKQVSGTYVTGATDSTLTLTGTTLGLNLANANTFTANQTISGSTLYDGLKLTGNQSPTLRFYTSLGGADDRNYSITTTQGINGNFVINQSATSGGDPSNRPVFAINRFGGFGFGTGGENFTRPTPLPSDSRVLEIMSNNTGQGVGILARRGGDNLTGFNLWEYGGNTYLDNYYDDDSSKFRLRVKAGNATPVVAQTLMGNGDIGIGVDSSISARFHIVKTTEQLRVGYDASNYFSATVGNTGSTTFNAVGSGAKFNFSDVVNLPTYTVATLPTGATGDIARVSDGDASLAWGDTVINSGAGATPYMVWYNGSNWTVTGK